MRQGTLCVNVHRPDLLPIKLTEQNGQTMGDLWPPLLPQPALTTATPERSHLHFLAFSLSHTFPASGAHCCHESSVSCPLNVNLTLCSLLNRKAWAYTVDSVFDDVHWLYHRHSLLFYLLKVVLEHFMLYCWGRRKETRRRLDCICFTIKLSGCHSDDIWVYHYWPFRYQLLFFWTIRPSHCLSVSRFLSHSHTCTHTQNQLYKKTRVFARRGSLWLWR